MDIAMILVLVLDVHSAINITGKMAKILFKHTKINHDLSQKVMFRFHHRDNF